MEFTRFYKDEVPDELWANFYVDLIKAGRDRKTFYSIPRRDVMGFVSHVRRSNCPWWMIFKDNTPCAITWLTGIEGKSARIHHACLPVLSGREVIRALRYCAASILYDQYFDGVYMMDSLTGLTPVWNKPAVKLLKHTGAILLGEIPGACYSHDSQTNAAGMVSYFTRNSVPREWTGG